MRALTQRMLTQSGYDAAVNPVIASLADFAAQRSGIDARDYFSEWRDRIGLIYGPGEFPQEGMCRTGSVHEKSENRWGRFLAVQMDDSSDLEYVHSLTERGIGAYLIEGTRPADNPESRVYKAHGKWAVREIAGGEFPVLFKTKREAVGMARANATLHGIV